MMILSSILYVPLAYYLIVGLGMDITSIGIAMAIQQGIVFISSMIYTLSIKEISEAVFFPGLDSFSGWYNYLSISLPATVMLCSEWWGF